MRTFEQKMSVRSHRGHYWGPGLVEQRPGWTESWESERPPRCLPGNAGMGPPIDKRV